MPKELYIDTPKHFVIREYEEPALQETQVRIQSEFSAIKHGTEFHLFSGESPFAKMKFDEQLRMFVERSPHDPPESYLYPGNMAVGTIVEVGNAVKHVHVGDRVYTYAPMSGCLLETMVDVVLHTGYEDVFGGGGPAL